jgi:hypothetical protein
MPRGRETHFFDRLARKPKRYHVLSASILLQPTSYEHRSDVLERDFRTITRCHIND